MSNQRKIYDPIHRFIHLDLIESNLVVSEPFQRLQYIHQLGVAFLVYPGATHKRYEHSLGVMEIATMIYDQVTVRADNNKYLDLVPSPGSKEHIYWRRILRLAALCHDLGHLPFSHTAEKSVLPENQTHESWTINIIKSDILAPIWNALGEEYPDKNVIDDIIKIAVGEEKCFTPFTEWEKVLTQIITADYYGADRIDYLLRDAKYTGLAYGLFDYHQLIEALVILQTDNGLQLGVDENGVESCESLLLARHFMHKRMCEYSSVKSYSFHMSRLMKYLYKENNALKDIESYISMTDIEVQYALNKIAKDPKHPMYNHAVSLKSRGERFKTIVLKSPLTKNQIFTIQKKLDIPLESIGWDMNPKSNSVLSLDIPVMRRNGKLTTSSKISNLTIPVHQMSWLFVSEEYEKSLREYL